MTAPYTPQFLLPSAPGQLSNLRGNSDSLAVKNRYANPRGASQVLSLMRIRFLRSAVSGNPSTPTIAFDSGWMGAQPASQPLPVGKNACGGNCTAVYNGRMYFMPSDGTIMSAPAAGPAVGKWRFENPLTSTVSVSVLPTVYSMTIVANRLYAIATAIQAVSGQATLFMSTINGDGTIGAWIQVPGGIIIQSNATWAQAGCVGGWDGKSATGFIVLWNTALNITTVTVNISDGSITAPAVDSTRVPTVVRDNMAFAFIAPGNAANTYIIGFIGGTATTATTVVDKASINPTTGQSIGAFAAGAALPAARIGGAGLVTAHGTIFYFGGSSTNASANATNTMYFNTPQRIDAATAWGTSTHTLPAAVWQAGAAIAGAELDQAGSTANTGNCVFLAVMGGFNTGGAAQTTTVLGGVNPVSTAFGDDVYSWFAGGNGTALTAAMMGAPSTLVSNQDGTIDTSAIYAANGTLNGNFCGSGPLPGGFLDGDQATIQVTQVGTDGDYSQTAISVIKIGQAPTVSAIAPTGATSDGRPLLTFSFNPGAGGDAEFSYQIQLKNGATVLFDSGVRYDGANSVQSLLAPYLASGTTYTVQVNATSRDTPTTGSVASASGSTTFTPTLSAVGTPSGLTVVPNHSLGSVTLSWTNNAPTPANPGSRVYYRRNGTSPWFLLYEPGALVGGATISDRLALTVGYDFAVSQLDMTAHGESALSNIISNVKIDPVAGGYSACLHVQGAVGTQIAPAAHFVALLVQGSPNDRTKLDMRTSVPFQQLAPVARYGVAHYAELALRTFLQDLAHLKSLQDVINTAFAGSPLVYRDGFGAMVVCSPMADHALVYQPPLYRDVDTNLLQVPDVSGGWSVAIGSAQGYQAQVSGSATPLDPSELIL